MAAELAMPPFARAFRTILWGSILMIFDIRLDGFDILPDVVGHVLVGLGCIGGLPHLHDLQPVGRAAVWILAGATVFALTGDVLQVVAPAAAWEFETLMHARSTFALIAFTVLGRAVVGAWLPRHVRRWQTALVSLLMLTAVQLMAWVGGMALSFGWTSPGFGLLAAPIALFAFVVFLVWFVSTVYAIFSTLPALKRVRTDAPGAVAPML